MFTKIALPGAAVGYFGNGRDLKLSMVWQQSEAKFCLLQTLKFRLGGMLDKIPSQRNEREYVPGLIRHMNQNVILWFPWCEHSLSVIDVWPTLAHVKFRSRFGMPARGL